MKTNSANFDVNKYYIVHHTTMALLNVSNHAAALFRVWCEDVFTVKFCFADEEVITIASQLVVDVCHWCDERFVLQLIVFCNNHMNSSANYFYTLFQYN